MNLLRKKQTVKVEDRLLTTYEDIFEQAVQCIKLQGEHQYTKALAGWLKIYAVINDCYKFLTEVNGSDTRYVRTHEQYTLLNRIQEIEKRSMAEISYLEDILEQQRVYETGGAGAVANSGVDANASSSNDLIQLDDYNYNDDLQPPYAQSPSRRGSGQSPSNSLHLARTTSNTTSTVNSTGNSTGNSTTNSTTNSTSNSLGNTSTASRPMIKTLRSTKPAKYQATTDQATTSMTAAALAWPGRSNSATSTSSINSDSGGVPGSNGRAVSPHKSSGSNSRSSSFGNNVATNMDKFSLRGPAQGFNKLHDGRSTKVARKPVSSVGGGSSAGSSIPESSAGAGGDNGLPSIVLRPAKTKQNSYNNSPPKPRPPLPSPKPSSLRPAKGAATKGETVNTASKNAAASATSNPTTSAYVVNASIVASAKKRQMAYTSGAARAGANGNNGKPVVLTADGGGNGKTASGGNDDDTQDKNDMDDFDKRMDKVIKNLRGVDKAAAKQVANEIVERGDEVHWDDIAGLEQAKASLKEAVVYPFLRPDLFSGLREPARGMLLFGPPGTGKTMLARAVATESKSTFFSISASSLTSKYLGESEKLVRALFEMSKALAPSIIFVDEIDSLLSQRSDSGEHEASRRIKNEFLIQWSALQSAAAGSKKDDGDVERVLVLAATNLPWAIDEAARRRFVRRQYIPLPERETRLQHLRKLMQNQTHALSEEDYEKILGLTDGFSGSDITALAKDAAMGPLRSLGEALLTTPRDQIRPIGVEDFVASLKTIRPSVSVDGLKGYEEWAQLYGSSGA